MTAPMAVLPLEFDLVTIVSMGPVVHMVPVAPMAPNCSYGYIYGYPYGCSYG